MPNANQPITAAIREGNAVTLDIPGAWHYGLTGRVLRADIDKVTVRFEGRGAVTAPTALALFVV